MTGLLSRLFGPRKPKTIAELRARQTGRTWSVESVTSVRPDGVVSGVAEDFAVRLYDQLAPQPGNLFFSPLSIRVALGMAELGAAGTTAAQLRELLGMAASGSADHAGVGTRLRRLAAGACELRVANALCTQIGAPLLGEFTDLVEKHYEAHVESLDFHDPTVPQRLNRWIEERTNGRIPELLPPELDPLTRLILLNTVYFKGSWLRPFEPDLTEEEPFRLGGGRTVTVPLMRHFGYVPYFRGRDYQAVDLSYDGDELSMLVLLPDRDDGLPEIESSLPGCMQDCSSLHARQVLLRLPRFTLSPATLPLRERLVALGMSDAFDWDRADFSGVNGLRPPDERALSVSDVLHKAFVEVNETGTEASAATVVEMLCGSAASRPVIPVFRADHPFLFAIRERATGAILFMGRLADPSRHPGSQQPSLGFEARR